MWELFPGMLHFHRFQDSPTSLPTLERLGSTELSDLTLHHRVFVCGLMVFVTVV